MPRRGEPAAPKPRRPSAVTDGHKETPDRAAEPSDSRLDAAPVRPAEPSTEPVARAPVDPEAIQRAAWQRRLGEIEKLIQERSYPEAKRLADNLAGEASVPGEIQRKARDLAERAQTELRKIFAGASFGAENHRVHPKSSPPPS